MPATLAFAVLGNTRSAAYLNRALMQLSLVLAGSLLIAVSAQVSIPLPFTPVPITGQSLAVLLVGTLLGARRGAAATLAYLAEGAAGLPFFSGGAFGLIHFVGPTAGYLFAFPIAAFVAGWLAERRLDRRFATSLAGFLVGHAIIFGLGCFWLSFFVGKDQALAAGFYPFISGTVIKAGLLAVLLPSSWKLVKELDQ